MYLSQSYQRSQNSKSCKTNPRISIISYQRTKMYESWSFSLHQSMRARFAQSGNQLQDQSFLIIKGNIIKIIVTSLIILKYCINFNCYYSFCQIYIHDSRLQLYQKFLPLLFLFELKKYAFFIYCYLFKPKVHLYPTNSREEH